MNHVFFGSDIPLGRSRSKAHVSRAGGIWIIRFADVFMMPDDLTERKYNGNGCADTCSSSNMMEIVLSVM